MNEITATTHMAASPAAVFAACSDFEHAAENIEAITKMEMLTPGPVGKGTRFRETRKMLGKEATETMEVLEFSPNTTYVLGAESCGSRYRTTFTFTPSGAGTDVEFRFAATPLTFMARLMGAVMMPMMKGVLRKCVMQDLADIKKRVESAA